MNEGRMGAARLGSIQSLLGVFQESLAGVSFPDVNGESLERELAVLEERRLAVSTAHSALVAAERALLEQEQLLLEHARQALAYARLYSRSRPELAERLGNIELESLTPLRRKRGRPRKQASAPAPARDAVAVSVTTPVNPAPPDAARPASDAVRPTSDAATSDAARPTSDAATSDAATSDAATSDAARPTSDAATSDSSAAGQRAAADGAPRVGRSRAHRGQAVAG